ncbi:DUF1194 domain-containing protein [Sulfitobacter sabulilitoris]|uniref:DUF1194 domain-containing protein n=1 Tax=Sulfitobacter sabulilitoris TaxID=2562655 RepID=A0A5S3PMU7_9RHOB|nr:DUF1194 domain-containing protein [Sulfitobacter sabulilitoris]TMM54900.1 DUF1194 domain-containing protein [Sulfitobacter sabulilitoris]
MRLFCLIFLWLGWPAALIAQPVEVDVELFLAVDVSRSMSPSELEIQRRGYAEALTDPDVIAAIRGGLLGRVALTYVEWAGDVSQRVVVPWTLIETAADAATVAEAITAHFDDGLRRTSISGALMYALHDFDGNGFEGLRRVVDVSGDGPNNQGRPVTRARDAVLAEGIVINGLPLMTQDALSQRWGIPDLDVYYLRCVIGGPGSFVIPVYDWDQFAGAITRKLILEIAQRPTRLWQAQMQALPPYDCLVGEKIWQQNRYYFDTP